MTVHSYRKGYWGGYTERGELLHYMIRSEGGSACGLALTGGVYDVPSDVLADMSTCNRCEAAARRSTE